MSDPYIEIWRASGREPVPLRGRATIGSAVTNDLVVDDDPTVSRIHAVLEPYPSGWAVRDVGSRNGTYVNGERIIGERALRDGDEVRVGGTRLIFRARPTAVSGPVTAAADASPDVTRREREVLLALCRPVLAGSLLTEPASVREMAKELVVSESAVKKHITNLYDKFGLHDPADRRRGRLAGEAIRRGAISLSDLRAAAGGMEP